MLGHPPALNGVVLSAGEGPPPGGGVVLGEQLLLDLQTAAQLHLVCQPLRHFDLAALVTRLEHCSVLCVRLPLKTLWALQLAQKLVRKPMWSWGATSMGLLMCHIGAPSALLCAFSVARLSSERADLKQGYDCPCSGSVNF